MRSLSASSTRSLWRNNNKKDQLISQLVLFYLCLTGDKEKRNRSPDQFLFLTICPQMIQSASCGHDGGVLPIRDVR